MATTKSHPADAAAKSTPKKTVMVPVGIPGYTLRQESRQVPTTEPPVRSLPPPKDDMGRE